MVLTVLVGAVLTASLWPAEGALRPSATPTSKPAATEPAEAVAEPSDVFDWWNLEASAPQVQFLASDDAHDGGSSLQVLSSLGSGTPVTAQLEQTLSVVPGETYSVTFWVKSENAGERGLEVSLSPDGSSRIAIPVGTYDWTQVQASYSVPVDQSTVSVRIIAQGTTTSTWVDSLALAGSEGTGPLMNADFESNSAALAITSPSLLLTEGGGSLDVATRRSASGPLLWAVSDQAGQRIAEGEAQFADFGSSIDLSGVPRGMHTLALSATLGGWTVERSTAFAVLEPLALDGKADADSPFGVFLHYLGGEPRLTNMVGSLATAGVNHARVEMTWPAIEVDRGAYRFTDPIESTMKSLDRAGINPLMVPVYGNTHYDSGRTPSTPAGLAAYARFSSGVIDHYADIGSDIEVYNEFDHIFNSGLCGPTPACYMDMLVATAKKVKAKTPEAVVVAPGNAGMGLKLDSLQQFFDLGGLEYTDVVSAHPYVQPHPPEQLIGDIDQLVGMIKAANGGKSKPIWFTEMGWASVDGWVSETQQAEYLVRTMAISLGHGVSRVYWFEAANISMNKENGEMNFGLFEAPSSFLPNSNAPKMAAVAQSVMARQLVGRDYLAADAVADGVYSYVFTGTAGATRVMWAPGTSRSVAVHAAAAVTVTDIFGRVTTVQPENGIATIVLSDSPVYVSGDIDHVAAG